MQKILIVDDNAELLNVLQIGFKDAGFQVRIAGSGVEALRYVESFSPDVIVLDLALPELDGFAVCENLKRNRATASIPILVLTGLSSQLSRFAGLESGADEYVTKPFNFKVVLSKVKELLEKSRASARKQAGACVSA